MMVASWLIRTLLLAIVSYSCCRSLPQLRPSPLPQLYSLPDGEAQQYVENLVRERTEVFKQIACNTDPPTFENTILALDQYVAGYSSERNACHILKMSQTGSQERRTMFSVLNNLEYLCSAVVYRRVRVVMQSLPDDSVEYRLGFACESLLRHSGSAFTPKDLQQYHQLLETILFVLSAQTGMDQDERIRTMIQTRSELSHMLRKRRGSGSNDIHTVCIGASWTINLSCAGSIEDIQSTLHSMSQIFQNTGLYDLLQNVEKLCGSPEWPQIHVNLLSLLPSLRQYSWDLNDILWKGLFFIAEKLYGLRVRRRRDVHLLHSSVMAFELTEENGDPLGLLFLDLFHREHKAEGRQTIPLLYRCKRQGAGQAAVGIFMDFPSPSYRPTLFDVWHLFHEFGHALHALFINTEYHLLSRLGPLDWAEFPSQLHEMWTTDAQVLRNIDPDLRMEEIHNMQIELRLCTAFKVFDDFLCSIRALYWSQISRAPDDLQSATRFLQRQYGLEWMKSAEQYLGPDFLLGDQSYEMQAYGYVYSWRIARSAQEWVKDNGGLCREVGEKLRRDVLEKGISVPYENMTDLFYRTHRHVTLLDDLRALFRLRP